MSIKKRDLIISISTDKKLNIWNLSNMECLIEIKGKSFIFTSCFIKENN